ncbi:hypothetical protein IJM86_05705 [bacterium]|nr:hypothetical protein [bacterium]
MKLNKQTTRLKDLNDAVSGGLRMQFNRKYDTIDSDYEKLKAGLEGCPLMSGFEDYLNELRKDPNYGNFEN